MKKINKATARKLFNAGHDFWITACNMRPEYGNYVCDYIRDDFSDFDRLVNAFIYYNCDNERGRYPAYYIEDGQ